MDHLWDLVRDAWSGFVLPPIHRIDANLQGVRRETVPHVDNQPKVFLEAASHILDIDPSAAMNPEVCELGAAPPGPGFVTSECTQKFQALVCVNV